ncbi:hypothetical protein PpBr36_04889 [Pyricularia pennisetigena]|uniref:hypothetical protein n=1 Tax=Pyricularia pennisetigena TaxID=1578925 RepID=UPI00114DD42A|nr:hypothetical protein PpBr36_04889 [Pyricularia pennisetigena]TLS27043.1 hypothetical protein PpBr36_04889 [Pyricularia pennisetigena]
MTASFNIAVIVMLTIFSGFMILAGICRFRLLLWFANYERGPRRARAIARAWDTTGTTRTTARSRRTQRQSGLPPYSLEPRVGEISVSHSEYGIADDDPRSDMHLSQMLRDLEQPPPAYRGPGTPR